MQPFGGKIRILCMLLGSFISTACGFNSTQKNSVLSAPYVNLVGNQQVYKIEVEIADSITSRARGLMYRKELGENHGMLFIFSSSSKRSFWMKNTTIPLDMIFIDEHQTIVGIVENATPETTTARAVDSSSRYVLEVNGGFCQKHQVPVGSKVDFHLH